MSNRSAREERHQRRLAAERAQAARRERRRNLLWFGGSAAMLALAGAVVALAASGGGSHRTPLLTPAATGAPAAPAASDAGGPAPSQIQANLREGDRVVEAGVSGRLAALRGVPVVVNMWASWCPNCKFEFPFFQRQSGSLRSQVAFLGLDSQDTRGGAEAFLRQHPIDYPSIFDESAQQAQSIGAGQGWPTTIYYDRSGRQTFVHDGAYASEAALASDIRTYALGQ